MKNIERRQDTRRKIQLGGLVRKAKLDHESTAILYGMLLDAAEKLNGENGQSYRDKWKIKGDMALTFNNES